MNITEYPVNQLFDIIKTQVGVNFLIDYAKQNGRLCSELEQLILECGFGPIPQYYYAKEVIKDRWPEAEPYIMKEPSVAFWYARDVIKGRWPEAEPIIKTHLSLSINYAQHVIKDRWPEIEPEVLTNIKFAQSYCNDIIKGPWLELDTLILNTNNYEILNHIQIYKQERWPEAESILMKEPVAACYYATYVIKGRWPEAEQIILNSEYKDSYLQMCEQQPRNKTPWYKRG